jgi:poly(3-hydroxybutyrate) depolymerase
LNKRDTELCFRVSELSTSSSGGNPFEKPVPVIIIMGTDDPIVPYEGREESFMSAEATAAFWVEINRIISEPEVDYLDQIKDDDPYPEQADILDRRH